MSDQTHISWCDHTFNPWWGCAHISPGCANCYAETLAARWGHDVWGKQGPRRLFGPDTWRKPLLWDRKAAAAGKRARVFCASMADVFEPHPALPPERAKLWDLIAATPNLDWLLLTKRPELVPQMVPPAWLDGFPRNVWMGVSAEDQQRADERIPSLLELPAAIRFVSAEPLLGPLDLHPSEWLPSLDWVIVGGESGPGARLMDPAWAASIAAQCEQTGTAFHGKQGGGRRPGTQGPMPAHLWERKQFPAPKTY